MTTRRFVYCALATIGLVAGSARPAFAQLDPLLPVKRLPPNVIVVVDTSFRMLDDGTGKYYDTKTYTRAGDPAVAAALGVTANTYRRIYQNLLVDSIQDSNHRYTATNIIAVQDTSSSFATFWAPTRFEMAKSGIAQAVGENNSLVRWGLLKLRQKNPGWASNCEKPVIVSASGLSGLSDSSPCNAGGNGRYGLYPPDTGASNFATNASQGNPIVVSTGSSNAAANIITIAGRGINDNQGLIPAGRDTNSYMDRPIDVALSDVRGEAVSAISGDSAALRPCRNTVVVLITGGKDSGDSSYVSGHNPLTTAGTFASVSAGGVSRRVPIIVVGVKPAAADEAQLTGIATASGGRYFRANTAADVAMAVDYAVQLGYTHSTDLDAVRPSEYTFVSPVIGTVNLDGAKDANGSTLPNTTITATQGNAVGQPVPQRSNMLVEAGFSMPGFDGHLRAFRVFKPVADATKPTGWKFVKDGTRLWPNLDDRPQLAGQARVPEPESARNIYTYIPNGTGGGQMVAFTTTESATLAPHLGGADPAVLIPFIRSQPLGAVIGSTPAIMDPPSLDPPPDDDYGFPNSVGTFAGTHKDRRSMIFFGAQDGMIHAVDARSGYEMWAFIPYNLLPKLRTLLDGQPVEQFEYFVDSSPKIAEVKVGGTWKSLLIIGQAYGGTFYQAFDVSEAGMGVSPSADGLSAVTSLLTHFDTVGESISFKWAFPNYSSFDPAINVVLSLADGFPGGKITFYGDLKASATLAEKSVGFTWSDPAVGPLTSDRSVNAVLTGSGYFPDVEGSLPGRGVSAPKAGHSFFMLDAGTGLPIGNASGSACSGTGCLDVGDTSNGRKNTLQADVTASGLSGSPVVIKAYEGDSDGNYWRFDLTSAGAITKTSLIDTGQPIYGSSALLFVGTSDRYLFFSTGSDFLANTTPGGSGTFKLYGVKDSASVGVPGTVTFTQSLNSVSGNANNLPTNGERATSAPTVAGDIVFFTTTTDSNSADCADASAKLYAFTYLGTAAYDSNNNGRIDTNESPVVATTAGRATAPFIVDQHLYIGTSMLTGPGVTIFGDAEDFNNGVGQVGVRILSWREIR